MTIIKERVIENFKSVDKEYTVPADQEWLYVMLQRQTDALKSLRSMFQFLMILIILGIIVQGCNLVLSTPLR